MGDAHGTVRAEVMMTALMLMVWSALAQAGDTVSVKTCTEKSQPSDIKWDMARTVRIETEEGTGTGVVISPDGFIMTADHVVDGAKSISIVFSDDHKQSGVVVRSSAKADLALVRVDQKNLPCMPVRANPADVGSDLLIIGSPGGAALTNSVSKGIVSGYREVDGRTVVQTDATLNAGNSGGPMISSSGELIGIVSFKMVGTGVEGLGFGIASTNIPSELSLRWGMDTDASLFNVSATAVAAHATAAAMPLVEPGAGVQIQHNVAYTMSYQPRMGAVAGGALLLVSGIVIVSAADASYSKRSHSNSFDDSDSRTIKQVEDISGIGLALWGGVGLGLGFALPTKTAPIHIVAPASAEDE